MGWWDALWDILTAGLHKVAFFPAHTRLPLGFYLNHAQNFKTAAWILCITFYLTPVWLLFHGDDLHDAMILAFPILLLCAAFLSVDFR